MKSVATLLSPSLFTTYVESDLAFALSRVSGVQQQYTELSRGVLQAMYLA